MKYILLLGILFALLALDSCEPSTFTRVPEAHGYYIVIEQRRDGTKISTLYGPDSSVRAHSIY